MANAVTQTNQSCQLCKLAAVSPMHCDYHNPDFRRRTTHSTMSRWHADIAELTELGMNALAR